jgi:prolyl oligopeptidase PreP (S9A serine peptidase family)
VKPVTETLWGKQVTDNYRYMEALDAQTLAWMKAQSAYTRSLLRIPLKMTDCSAGR